MNVTCDMRGQKTEEIQRPKGNKKKEGRKQKEKKKMAIEKKEEERFGCFEFEDGEQNVGKCRKRTVREQTISSYLVSE